MKFHILIGLAATAAVAEPIVQQAPPPIRISLRSRPRPLGDLSKRQTTATEPITTWFRNFDLQWYGNISVGTPPTQHTVVFDTGSNALILPSTATKLTNHSTFDASKSSSFSSKPGTNISFDFATAGDAIPRNQTGSVGGTIVTDVVSLAGLNITNQTWMLANVWPESLSLMPGIDGIFGMGPPGIPILPPLNASLSNFFWNLVAKNALAQPFFSFYMESGKGAAPGELILGGTDPSKYNGPVFNVPINTTLAPQLFSWVANQQSVTVDGEPVRNSVSNTSYPMAAAVLDTGNAYIQAPDHATAKDVYAAISPDIKVIDELGAWGAKCDVIQNISATLDLSFTIGTEYQYYNVKLNGSNFNLGEYPGQSGICQTAILHPVTPITDLIDVWILGSVILKQYYTIWNGTVIEQPVVGFATLKGSSNGTGSTGQYSANPVPTATATPTSTPTQTPSNGAHATLSSSAFLFFSALVASFVLL